MTGSTTVSCWHSNWYLSFWRTQGDRTARFSVLLTILEGVRLCECLGEPIHSENAFVFPGLLPIAGRGGKTPLPVSHFSFRLPLLFLQFKTFSL